MKVYDEWLLILGALWNEVIETIDQAILHLHLVYRLL